jgi:uncharacterized protein YbbC (DUF1343 family)
VCLFEGTVISVGRGTDKPFQQWGNPLLAGRSADTFTPMSTMGASKPPYEGKTCYGRIATPTDVNAAEQGILVGYLMDMYSKYPDKDKFFTPFFEKLAGTKNLRLQIINGTSALGIKKSWAPGIKAYKQVRKKYLLYKDFE